MVERNFGGRSYNSFAGADIKAVFGYKEIGELQAVSYAIQREKAPIYVMGHKNPRAFSRGKRGIAGTLVFVMFDQHSLISEMGIYSEDGPNFLADKHEYRPDPSTGVNPVGVDVDPTASGAVSADGNIDFTASYGTHKAWYVDQIPPFDITITAANEYGATMSMRIIGVEILNEGYGVSVDDIVSEQQMTYVARAVSPWRRAENPWSFDYTGGSSTVTGP